MTAEEGAGAEPATITTCDPGRHLGLCWIVGDVEWPIDVAIEHTDGDTILTFVHHFREVHGVADITAGWGYYLDRLVSYIAGVPFAEWDTYHPALTERYQELEPEAS